MKSSILEQKQSQVAALVERINSAKTIVAFDYLGLSVAAFTKLRNELRKEGCDVAVFKNNIARRAVTDLGMESLAEALVGGKALAFGYTDVIAPARVVYTFAKDNPKVKMSVGIIEGKAATAEEITALATLPSYETLLTQLAAGLLMPLRELAVGLNMISSEQEAA
ncbi:MAG: 50S ribosomal protein L10 [Acholeplasmataceae bacterium]